MDRADTARVPDAGAPKPTNQTTTGSSNKKEFRQHIKSSHKRLHRGLTQSQCGVIL